MDEQVFRKSCIMKDRCSIILRTRNILNKYSRFNQLISALINIIRSISYDHIPTINCSSESPFASVSNMMSQDFR